MKKVMVLTALVVVMIASAFPAAAQSVDECRARAQWAEEETSGAMAGAAKGALGGAALGGLLGRSTGAKRGAALGAIVGGVRNKDEKREAYDEEFTRCMRESEAQERQK